MALPSPILLADGTASAPSFAFAADTNTGLYRPGADILAAATGGAERARLDSSGNLLVGVTSANANGGVLQLKSGISFPATQVAASDNNTLDDYEEGTWTPTITAATPPTGVTYAVQMANYTKIGDLVHVQGRLTLSNKGTGGSGAVSIVDLPFANGAKLTQGMVAGDFVTLGSGCTWAFLNISASTTVMNLNCSGSGISALSVQYSGIANNTDITFSATYKVN